MKAFKAKVGYGILIPVLMLLIGAMLLPIINRAPIGATLTMIAIMVPVIALTLQVFLGTTYGINDTNQLQINCGFLYNNSINISSIKSIRKTRNPMSSPAPSLDRIELKYGKWESVIISPKGKEAFVNELMKINPDIKHNLK